MRSLTPARVAVEQVRSHDLEIIVGRVGESSLAVALAERPDSRHVRAKLIVDNEVAMRVLGDAGVLEAKIIGIGSPPDRKQQM
jgi:hypothetical protein